MISFDDTLYFDDFEIVVKSKDNPNETYDEYNSVSTKLDELEKLLDESMKL